ncbi:hypothetical protein BIW11_03920 [Tropilaelaps mercedesae]|uniref:Uncharacterized protein n=1 Tax=Tropilaelaps mercedesae TaxID=418985 RepID=A0A1V9XE96_9ACAR|nr:hypothetical protein BIW11_03920 [Tropilaelaps mercedesae]
MDVPFMHDFEMYQGHFGCVPGRTNIRSDSADALGLKELEFSLYSQICSLLLCIPVFIMEISYFYLRKLFGTRSAI